MTTDRVLVLRSAVGLLVRRPTASMDEIAKAAGISRATLHRLVPNRNELVRQLAEVALTDTKVALAAARPEEGDPEAAVRRLVEALVPIGDFWSFLIGENQLADMPELESSWNELDQPLVALFRRGQESGAFRVDLPAEWLTDALTMLLAGVGWAVHHGRLAPRDATRAIAELLLNGAIRKATS